MAAPKLVEGPGCFVFSDQGATNWSVRVHYFCPSGPVENARIAIALHGLDRAAEEFRDILVGPAERTGQIIIVPEFDLVQFSGSYAYNQGYVTGPPPSNFPRPREQWSFYLIDRLFQHVRSTTSSKHDTFGLFGNSAGGQFVLRYLALTEAKTVDRAVAANIGWYMLPDLARDYPIGMCGVGAGDGDLRRYLQRPLTIILGEGDCDPNAHDLPRLDAAMAQGPHRLARGLWYFDHCKQLALDLNIDFGWILMTIPGAGHIDPPIFENGIRLLSD